VGKGFVAYLRGNQQFLLYIQACHSILLGVVTCSGRKGNFQLLYLIQTLPILVIVKSHSAHGAVLEVGWNQKPHTLSAVFAQQTLLSLWNRVLGAL
jgi:hypothetical protein